MPLDGNTQEINQPPAGGLWDPTGPGIGTVLSGFSIGQPIAPVLTSFRPQFPDGLQLVSSWRRTAVDPLRGRITGPVRLIGAIRTAWSLSEAELAQLLSYPSVELIGRLLEGGITFRPESDQGDRVRIMYRVHSTLAGLFVDPADEGRWLRDGIDFFDNLSPLEYMLEHRIPGMLHVEDFIERRLANR
jgi:hypothetical protein